MDKNTKVLIVDDSSLMQKMIGELIEEADGLEVVGLADSGEEALSLIEQSKPDVVTLDVEMPGMNGLETLKKLMATSPVPVIMVSAFTQRGAELTQQALELGALDFVAKPAGLDQYQGEFRNQLINKIRNFASADVERILKIRSAKNASRKLHKKSHTSVQDRYILKDFCVAIGVSTGGPPALSQVIPSLEPPFPAIFIVQHMPETFTRALANRLDSISRLTVQEAEDGLKVEPNNVYIAAGGKHMGIRKKGSQVEISVFDGPPVSAHRPSVDVMMGDVAKIYGSKTVGVIMTGMGKDGSDGCGVLKSNGAFVLGQDEESSDVYGMNKAAFVAGHVDEQFHLDQLPEMLTSQVNKLIGSTASSSTR